MVVQNIALKCLHNIYALCVMREQNNNLIFPILDLFDDYNIMWCIGRTYTYYNILISNNAIIEII